MTTHGNSFERLMEEILSQQSHLQQLETENLDLRRQLSELREGRGIFLNIQATPFALVAEAGLDTSENASVESAPTIVHELPTQSFAQLPGPQTTTPLASATWETPTSRPSITEQETSQNLTLPPSFLEELLLEEFAEASTGPVASLPEQPDNKTSEPASEQQGPLNEEAKALLRRELMGSFLLE